MDTQDKHIKFGRWVDEFRPRAIANGISSACFDTAFRHVRFNAAVIANDQNQAEFSKPIWDYLALVASDTRRRDGRANLQKHARLLDRLERQYNVDKTAILAVWGMESNYGARRGDINTVEALATLSFDGRRAAFFEGQLLDALHILDSGDIAPQHMLGSWAGAMGHTQFIPSSYLSYAVDFDGDGRRDIWGDDPTDALASTAQYLAQHGWKLGQPWGVEITLPRDFDYRLATRKTRKSCAKWAAYGARALDGRAARDHGDAWIWLPAGAQGPAFMVFDNFEVILRYNNADAYAFGVGHLADRIDGARAIVGQWPRQNRGLIRAEMQELQTRLTAAGHDTIGADGMVGPNTRAAIRAFQIAQGIAADGWGSLDLLETISQSD